MEKYYQPQKLRNRHLAMMEELLANPEVSQNDLAQKLGLTPSRFSIIINSPLFQYAFKEYRRDHMEKISDLVADATTAAIKFSKDVIENQNVEMATRQVSARDILSQGHAKAVEKRANLNLDVPVPVEALKGLDKVLAEVATPFKPTRSLSVPQGGEDEDS